MARSADAREGSNHQGWHQLSLRGAVSILIVVVGAVTLVANGLSIWRDVQTRQLVEQQQQTVAPAVRHTAALLGALNGQLAAEGDFVLTGQAAALLPYRAGQPTVDQLESQLRREVAGQPRELAELNDATVLFQQWVTTVATPEIADAEASGSAAAAAALVRSGEGRATFVAIRTHIAELAAEAGSRSQSLSDDLLGDANNALTLALVRSWFLLAILATLWLLLNRLVSYPVERLNNDVETVAAGSLDHPIDAHGLRDLATLGRNTEAMRRALRDDSEELRQLRQALTQRSPLHRLISSELKSTEDPLDTSIAGRLLPADGVLAGDWYDAWGVGEGHVALALVDVSGHGPEAGLMALRLKHLLAPPFRMGMAPGTAVGWVADQLDDLDEQCATAFVLEYDPATGQGRYANAGHPGGLLFQRQGVTSLDRTGPLICGLRGRSWETRPLQAEEGDLLVLVTDGLIEARLPDGSEFGLDRIEAIVTDLGRSASPDQVAEGLIAGVREACTTPLRDDATVVVVNFEGATPGAR